MRVKVKKLYILSNSNFAGQTKHTPTPTHTNTHPPTQTHTHAHAHPHTHAHSHTHPHTHTHTHTHTHKHPHTRTHTHTNTHTHAVTFKKSFICIVYALILRTSYNIVTSKETMTESPLNGMIEACCDVIMITNGMFCLFLKPAIHFLRTGCCPR